LVHFVSAPKQGIFVGNVIPDVVVMVASNIFRTLPSSRKRGIIIIIILSSLSFFLLFLFVFVFVFWLLLLSSFLLFYDYYLLLLSLSLGIDALGKPSPWMRIGEDTSENDTFMDEEWPHLQIVYEFFLKYLPPSLFP
jgi:hypothetical protein